MTKMREIHWLRRIKLPYVALAMTTIAVFLPIGCLLEDELDGRSNPDDPNGSLCLDEDGDGFGKGCVKGIDCDDSNPGALDECYRCVSPDKGCPCATESEQAGCGKVEMAIGTQLVCGQGITTCTNGAWSECIINNSVTLAPKTAGLDPLGFGGPSPCTNNPCDPACTTFNDDPTGLTNIDAGIITVDGGDAGLTLPGSVPPAPITCTGGSDSTCAHTMCTVGTKLTAGCDVPAPPPAGVQKPPELVFRETFNNNTQGWTVSNAEWEVAVPAVAGNGQNMSGGFNDPGTDHTTPQTDNRIAGFNVDTDTYNTKGIANIAATHAAYYLTSPALNTAGDWGNPVTLKFWRWLNSDLPTKTIHNVQVCNGATCVNLWTNQTPAVQVKDSAWTQVSYTIPAANVQANMKIRFGMQVLATNGSKISSWNIDDIEITKTPPPPPAVPAPPASCVSKVCAANVKPQCCTTAWTIDCVQQIFATCGVTCGALDGVCVTCWNDTYDHDGDGFSGAAGDCADCDPTINPSAYDFGGDFIDEDCTGTADDEITTCDSGLAIASTNPYDFAKAMELCQTTTLTSKDWGVITPGGAKFVQSDVDLELGTGAGVPNAIQYGIVTKSGTNNPRRMGANMAMFSTGTAREPLAAGWVNPNGSGSQANTSATMPPQFPKNKAGCPADAANTTRDSSGLWMMIRTPSNAKSFSFKFNMFSSEYPEWVCTNYNDTFIARLLTAFTPGNLPANGNNISFDANNNPVTVNNAFFTVPGCPTCTSPLLTATNLDGSCNSNNITGICGGATNWLYSAAPVNPNEIIRMNFEIWDEGDSQWDSWVVIDDWQWSVETTTIQTGAVPPGQPVQYTDGYFVRDYNLTGVCPTGTRVVWGLWSWNTTTPSTSSIDFKVQTASSLAGLAGAPSDALRFSNPPGPAGLAGQVVVARTGPPSTITGSSVVEETLKTNNRAINLPFLRITSHLAPSADKLNAPILKSWNLQTSCVASE